MLSLHCLMWYCMSDIIFHIHLCGDNKKTNKLIAPYRENYVHRILFFYVRISLTSTIKDRPVRIQQVDRHGRSNKNKNNTSKNKNRLT